MLTAIYAIVAEESLPKLCAAAMLPRIYLGTLPFLVADFVLVALLIWMPALALWLPAYLRM